METLYEPIKFILFIVNRGTGRVIDEFCKNEGIYGHLLLHGRGTADNETLALLGLGEKEKDLMILTVAESRAEYVMDAVSSLLHLEQPGRGIGLSIPFSSLASQLNTYDALAGNGPKLEPPGAEGTGKRSKKKRCSLFNKGGKKEY